MEAPHAVRPSIVALSSESSFLHLIQSLLDALDLPVRTSTDWGGAPRLVARVLPNLVVLDLLPGHEMACWLTLEAIKAQSTTVNIPVLLCPVADWLLQGHEARVAHHGVRTWRGTFDLEQLLHEVEAALNTPQPASPETTDERRALKDYPNESDLERPG
jgi:hypothetical protein